MIDTDPIIMEPSYPAILGAVVTAIIGFLFGKSGILTRIFDTRLRNVEYQQKREHNSMDTLLKENEALRKEIALLREKVTRLEGEIEHYIERMELILAYFDKVNSGKQDAFIERIALNKRTNSGKKTNEGKP